MEAWATCSGAVATNCSLAPCPTSGLALRSWAPGSMPRAHLSQTSIKSFSGMFLWNPHLSLWRTLGKYRCLKQCLEDSVVVWDWAPNSDTKANGLCLIPRSHKVKGEKWLLQAVLWPPHELETHTLSLSHPHPCTNAHMYTNTHVYMIGNRRFSFILTRFLRQLLGSVPDQLRRTTQGGKGLLWLTVLACRPMARQHDRGSCLLHGVLEAKKETGRDFTIPFKWPAYFYLAWSLKGSITFK